MSPIYLGELRRGKMKDSIHLGQIVQIRIFLSFTSAPQERLLLPRYNHLASIYFRTNFIRDSLRPELFVLTGLNQRQRLIRGRITKTICDHWSVGIGADFLGGKRTNVFGYFDSRD